MCSSDLVVAGVESSPEAIALARAAGEAMGKHVIDAVDGVGFLVNRCNRPFGLEGLRLVSERIAGVEQVDRICRQGGGFRMGPFELMDLVGVDTGLDISRSFYEQSFGEPRWRPSPITVKTVAAGRLGRKTGRGYYEYPEGSRHRADDPEPPAAGGGDGVIVIAGETQLATELALAADAAGWAVATPAQAQGLDPPFLILDLSGGDAPEAPLQGAPQAICLHAGSLMALDPGGAAVGFHALPPLDACRLVELAAGPDSPESATQVVCLPSVAKNRSAARIADSGLSGPAANSTSPQDSSGGSAWKPTAAPPGSSAVSEPACRQIACGAPCSGASGSSPPLRSRIRNGGSSSCA